MAAQNVCKWNKFGYCKHKECSRNKHIKELCENGACDIVNCIFRQPRSCKYYRDYGKCKFDPFMYLHDNKYDDKTENDIVKLKKENESISGKLLAIENTILELDTKIFNSEAILANLENFKERFEEWNNGKTIV